MESFQGKERDEKLDQLYKNLQQHWDAIKQCNPATRSRRDSTHSNITITIEKAFHLMNTSPRDLMSKLQQHSSSPQAWKQRTKDLVVQEIIRERKTAIETGKLKGRRLFEPMEGDTENEIGVSGDMGQESEVRSLSFDYSEDESYLSSSSSLPCLSCDTVDKDQEVMEVEAEDVRNIVVMFAKTGVSDNGGSRYIVIVGVIAIALLLFAMYMSWARSFEGYEVILVPT